VTGEAVAGIAAVELAHDGVPRYFGNDRRRGDRAHERVALRICALRHRQVGNLATIDQHVARDERPKRFERAAARGETRSIDVKAVDLLRLDHAEPDGERAAAYLRREPFTNGGLEHLGVRHAIE